MPDPIDPPKPISKKKTPQKKVARARPAITITDDPDDPPKIPTLTKQERAEIYKPKKRLPLHRIFGELIVKNVYAPSLWSLLNAGQQYTSLSALTQQFEHDFDCSVTTQQVKLWLDYLDIDLTSRVTLISKKTGQPIPITRKPLPQAEAPPTQEDLTHPNADMGGLPDPNLGAPVLESPEPLFAN